MTPEQRIQVLEDRLNHLEASDRYTFQKKLQIFDGRNVQVGKANGTSFGTEAAQKVSVHGVTPVVQGGAITAPTGGATIDSQARAAINSLIVAIKNFGITA